MNKKYIYVTYQKEGIHNFPGAITLKGVEFLQYPHRHTFHHKVTVEVGHNDRDIEFILFKRELEQLYPPDEPLSLGAQSCEMMAENILNYIRMNYPGREITVEVSEDGENGSIVAYVPKKNETSDDPTYALDHSKGTLLLQESTPE